MSFKTLLSDNNKLIALSNKHKAEKTKLENDIAQKQLNKFKEDTQEMLEYFSELGIVTNVTRYQDGSTELVVMWSNAMWIEVKQAKNEQTFTWGLKSSYEPKAKTTSTERTIVDVLSKAMVQINERYGLNSASKEFQQLFSL